ncbi:hypothetical protein [Streptomyces flavochromogenes]|nr:hypothetical protein [Streptomyces flavochromogenes]
MTEPPTERRVQPIVDMLAADTETLVELGVLDPQPEPEAPPPVVLPAP